MTTVPRLAAAVVGVLVGVILGAAPAGAALSISAPASANLGAAATGAPSLSGQLGTVTVTVTGLIATAFTATVSGSDFTTGTRTVQETIPKSSVAYWSGLTTGCASAATPGQATAANAQSLSSPRVAFSGLLLLGSCSWRPTLVVTIPSGAVQGTYAGTITHSVA